MKKTITVNSYFGPKEFTRDEFVDRWGSHMNDLYGLSMDHYPEFVKMKDRVKEIAGIEFDRLYKIQEEK